MRNLGECVFCGGSGKCEECNGTGINPHVSSVEGACPHCSGSGKCPECSGSALSPIGRPRKGSVLKYALLVVAALVGIFALMTFPNRIVAATGVILWMAILYALFYWDGHRTKSIPPSRF